MNKLTAKKCRERISSLKRNRRVFGLALDSEIYLQALEIALPVLEQQEKGGSDWTLWYGGECPVADGTVVDMKLRDGHVTNYYPAEYCVWNHSDCPGDIIAYRVVQQERERGDGEA